MFGEEVLVLGKRDVESEGLLGKGRVGVELQYSTAFEMAIFWMSKGRVL